MKNKLNPLIHHEEYVQINGINQYLFHSSSNSNNPVMLFLHGGPGSSLSIFSHAFQEKWEDIFTVVHWDQRCSGKTLTKNPDKHTTIDLMIQDLFELIQYLKKKYNKEKIILLGHSWGSVLGTMFIKQYPEEISYYIGVGQVINILENERVGYKKLKELILQANDKKSLRKLESIGDYPGDKFDFSDSNTLRKFRKLQGKYNLAVQMNFSLFCIPLKSPIFEFSDLFALIKGEKANKKIYDFLGKLDFNSESLDYDVPIYYILGDRDWQTPYQLAENYFNKINAPNKDIYIIPDAGHMTMLDAPELFLNALSEINSK